MLILVVDDEPSMTSVLGTLLSSELGAEVCKCSGNADAFEFLECQTPHLITTDIGHPEGGGLELVRHFRSSPRLALRMTRIAAISGRANSKNEADLYRLGCDLVVKKPFKVQELLDELSRLIGPHLPDECGKRMLLGL